LATAAPVPSRERIVRTPDALKNFPGQARIYKKSSG